MFDFKPLFQTLNLGFNEIGPDGGFAIVAALENKPHIKDVQLNGNQVSIVHGVCVVICSVHQIFSHLQFGSECRDQILECMMQYEKGDALGPLDEDDSDAEDEENDDENEEYVDEETEGDESDGEYGASDDEGEGEGDETFQSTRNFSSFNESGGAPSLNNFSLNNLNDSNSIAFVSEEPRPNTVETFCNTTVPTVAMFNALEENDKVLAFETFLHVN